MNLICFDLEGPLAPQDNAYELMKLFPLGDRIFEVISRYDDLLTLEGRPDYEPGDTLALIIPFLAYHGIGEEQIERMGRHARLTPGATHLISELDSRGWHVFCISTSYEQYASHVTHRLGIPPDNVACTSFPLDEIRRLLTRRDFAALEQVEREIAPLMPHVDDDAIKQRLDSLYRRRLPRTRWGKLIAQVKPVGGRRKVQALQRFSATVGKPLSDWVVVGDSITDSRMLHAVHATGGLAVAFNANEYSLPQATIGLASTDIHDLWTVLESWERGRRTSVETLVKEKERLGADGERRHFHWIEGKGDLGQPLEIHNRIRHLLREDAAQLG